LFRKEIKREKLSDEKISFSLFFNIDVANLETPSAQAS